MIEKLLNPRYEVIANYPHCEVEVGDILIKYIFVTSTMGMYTYVTNTEMPEKGGSISKEHVETMPHLFRKMNWWEKRTVQEMPKRVKSLADSQGDVFEIEEWDMEQLIGWIDKKERTCCSLLTWKPEYGYVPIE